MLYRLKLNCFKVSLTIAGFWPFFAHKSSKGWVLQNKNSKNHQKVEFCRTKTQNLQRSNFAKQKLKQSSKGWILQNKNSKTHQNVEFCTTKPQKIIKRLKFAEQNQKKSSKGWILKLKNHQNVELAEQKLETSSKGWILQNKNSKSPKVEFCTTKTKNHQKVEFCTTKTQKSSNGWILFDMSSGDLAGGEVCVFGAPVMAGFKEVPYQLVWSYSVAVSASVSDSVSLSLCFAFSPSKTSGGFRWWNIFCGKDAGKCCSRGEFCWTCPGSSPASQDMCYKMKLILVYHPLRSNDEGCRAWDSKDVCDCSVFGWSLVVTPKREITVLLLLAFSIFLVMGHRRWPRLDLRRMGSQSS